MEHPEAAASVFLTGLARAGVTASSVAIGHVGTDHFWVWNHEAGANPLGAAGKEDVATTSVPTGRNSDVTEAHILNFDRQGHLSQLDRTAFGSLPAQCATRGGTAQISV